MRADDPRRVANPWAGASASEDAALFTAQKVHALAQIVFRRLVEGWPSTSPWPGAAGPMAFRPHATGPWQPAPAARAAQPGASAAAPGSELQTLLYWYP